MYRTLVAATLITTFTLAGSAHAQRGGVDATKYGWLGSLEAGKAEARKSGKPLMVVLRCVP